LIEPGDSRAKEAGGVNGRPPRAAVTRAQSEFQLVICPIDRWLSCLLGQTADMSIVAVNSERRVLYERRQRAVLGCLAVLGLLALVVFGLVKTFGLHESRSLFGPLALMAAAGGFAALFSWARHRDDAYGLEPAVDGGETPRWYLRIAVLGAFAVSLFATAYSPSWFGLATTVVLAVPVAAVYRAGRRRRVRRWLWVESDEQHEIADRIRR
jgi:hypothetical protein